MKTRAVLMKWLIVDPRRIDKYYLSLQGEDIVAKDIYEYILKPKGW